ncbi:hypothetical protein J530_4996, partial [Acinetobacter baumannii 15827]
MGDIYQLLKPKKGYAYTKEQIIDASLVNLPIPTGKKLKGNSRVIGDVDEETFKIIVDTIISLCSRFNLEYQEMAYTLLICLAESGFPFLLFFNISLFPFLIILPLRSNNTGLSHN